MGGKLTYAPTLPPLPSLNLTCWIPDIVYNGTYHDWTFYNGTYYNQTGYNLTGFNLSIFPLINWGINRPTYPPPNYSRIPTPPTTPKPLPVPRPYPTRRGQLMYSTPRNPFDPGNRFGGPDNAIFGMENHMYEVRGIFYVNFPRKGLFDGKTLNSCISLDPEDRYFEGPASYGVSVAGAGSASAAGVMGYMLFTRCMGVVYPYKRMRCFKAGLVLVATMIIFFSVIGLCSQIMLTACIHNINSQFLRGSALILEELIELIEDAMKHVFKYLDELRLKLEFIKASAEGDVDLYFQPDDVLVTTTIGPNLKRDLAEGGWSSIYDHIMGEANKHEENDVWGPVAKQVAAAVWGITNDLKIMAASALSFLMKEIYHQVRSLDGPLKKFINDMKLVLRFLNYMNIMDIFVAIFGYIFYIYMIFLAICVIKSTVNEKNRKMKCLSRFCLSIMCLWYIIGSISWPLSFILIDLCYHPPQGVSLLMNALFKKMGDEDTGLTKETIFHYLTCDGVNPYVENLRFAISGLGYIVRALTRLLAEVQAYGEEAEKVVDLDKGIIVMSKVRAAQLKIYKSIMAGCNSSSEMFMDGIAEACNTCLMGLIVLSTIAPIMAFLWFMVVVLAMRIKNFIGLPIPGMNWKQYQKQQAKKEQKRLELIKRKQRKKEKADNKIRKKMAYKLLKQAKSLDAEKRFKPVEMARKRRRLLRQKREKEIRRLKQLAACFCVPAKWAVAKCPDQCEEVPDANALPPVSDPKDRQLELKELIREDRKKEKLLIKHEKVALADERNAFAHERKLQKKAEKAAAKAERIKRKKLRRKMRKAKEDDENFVEGDDEDEEEEQKKLEEAGKTCDDKCRGIDRLKAANAKLRSKRLKERSTRRKRKTQNPKTCPEDDCLKSEHANEQLAKAMANEEEAIDLECGCKVDTEVVKGANKFWKLKKLSTNA